MITALKDPKPPKGYLDVSDDDTWKSCLICGGMITQVRKALFTCTSCGLEYIGTEEDMRPDKIWSGEK